MNHRSQFIRSRVHFGFTLLELAVSLAVIAILAVIVTPIASRVMEDARVTRAAQEAQDIARAMLEFRRSTGRWPIFLSGVGITTSSTTFTVLMGPGADPAPSVSLWLPTNPVERGDLEGILGLNTPGFPTSGRFRWRGPYVGQVGSDPWGNAFIVNAEALKFGPQEATFVLSAGRNGTIETTFLQAIQSGSPVVVVGGDDIAARVR